LETALLIILTVLAALALCALWVRGVMAFFALKGQRPTARVVAAVDGWQLCAWHRTPSQRRFIEPVVLCHGLSNNHRFLEFQPPHSFAAALADAGFECITVELRGAGNAAPAPAGTRPDGCIDDYVKFDVPALISHALTHSGALKTFWVGHSLGGLVALAAAEGDTQEKLKGLITIGSPVFFRSQWGTRWLLKFGYWLSPLGRFRTDWFAALAAPLAGWFAVPVGSGMANQRNIPGWVQRRALATVIAPIWHGVLSQLRDWTLDDKFRSVDGKTDYRERVRDLKVPILVAGGSVDGLAPPANCRQHFALAGSADKELQMFGTEFGHQADYGHGDLLLGTRAHVEVYPKLIAWLEKRATPVE
jgi:pimeloyl-ACP methyl ester carboxylesterase